MNGHVRSPQASPRVTIDTGMRNAFEGWTSRDEIMNNDLSGKFSKHFLASFLFPDEWFRNSGESTRDFDSRFRLVIRAKEHRKDYSMETRSIFNPFTTDDKKTFWCSFGEYFLLYIFFISLYNFYETMKYIFLNSYLYAMT